MLKNITIGQYFPGDSIVHRLDPRTKLIITVLYVVMIFMADNLLGIGLCIAFTCIAYWVSKIPIKMAIRSIKAIMPIMIFTSVINIFFVKGEVLFSIWKISITREGISMALMLTTRILCLVAGTSLLTYTTSPIALTDGIERLFSPLQKLNLPVHEVAMMMTIALRFIPTLIEETDKIMSAQKSRGADMESGNIIQRAKALLPILVPLFVSAFRRADELALAMESRCYHGGEGRTRMNHIHFSIIDIIVPIFVVITVVGVILLNRIIMPF